MKAFKETNGGIWILGAMVMAWLAVPAWVPHALAQHGGDIAASDPFFAGAELISRPSRSLHGLARVERAGEAAWDRSSNGWYASANGMLVKVMPDGALPVVLDNVQGTDIDVRAAHQVAVCREPDTGIVLHRWSDEGSRESSVLLAGGAFFHPQFCADGSQVLVSESRAEGGHIWLLSPAAGATQLAAKAEKRDLGQGYGPTWHPDCRHVVFSRIVHDNLRVVAADLWMLDTLSGDERRLTDSAGIAEVEPAISPDGGSLVFVDALTGRIVETPFPSTELRRLEPPLPSVDLRHEVRP